MFSFHSVHLCFSIVEDEKTMIQKLATELQEWMGGETGPTSQGFRHMFFGGVDWQHPIQTFQIPFHSIGQAPERFEILRANKAGK